MSHKRRLFFFIAVVIFLLAACGGASAELAEPGAAPSFEFETAEERAPAEPALAGDVAAQIDVQEQLIIRTGNMAIVVEDTEETIDAIAALADARGGWVVSSNMRQLDTAKSGEVTIRIPVEEFDAVMDEIASLALEVRSTSTSSEDVTEEFVDLSARLENLEATADRVRSFLDEAQDVEEALAVNAELSRLEGEIESLKGRLQYLSQSAAFSTLSVNVTPDELSQPLEVGGWRPTGVFRDAVEALVSALQGLATVVIWIVVVLLPLALIILLPLGLVAYFVRRRLRRRQAPESAG